MSNSEFKFRKEYYECIKDLPANIRIEVVMAVLDYVFLGWIPENAKPITRNVFTLIKLNIDRDLQGKNVSEINEI